MHDKLSLENGMEHNGGLDTNFDVATPRKAEGVRKVYHAPQLMRLGPIESVVRVGNPTPGPDASLVPGSSHS